MYVIQFTYEYVMYVNYYLASFGNKKYSHKKVTLILFKNIADILVFPTWSLIG